jgi:hypothetical protein
MYNLVGAEKSLKKSDKRLEMYAEGKLGSDLSLTEKEGMRDPDD